jgi:hypothetical protein
MNNDDQKLKNQIVSDPIPNLPQKFIEQSLHRLQLEQIQKSPQGNTVLLINYWDHNKKWLYITLTIISILMIYHYQQTMVDEDLLRIDTLSMSSLSIL